MRLGGEDQFRFQCRHCPWYSAFWPTKEQASAEAVWHVYEQHPQLWQLLVGDRPPTDPDPRKKT